MPLHEKIKENNCKIAIWKMKESLEELIHLSKSLDISKLKTTKRQKEFLSIRLLLNELLPEANITYNQYGAPEIGSDNFISISHSKNLAAIIISKKNVGLDIEKISQKPLKLSSKFMSHEIHNNLSKEKATLIWSCKEAIFKWHQKGNINFISDVKISPFIIQEKGKLTAIFKHKEYTLHYKRINAYFLVYVCK